MTKVGQKPDNRLRQEIFYRGYFYDVTEFIDKHPGGSVILFYTEKGEDATQAIEQFHFRSRKKIKLMLQSFPRRLATSFDKKSDGMWQPRHKILTDDFQQLFMELKSEGYFEPSITHVLIRILEAIALLSLSLGIFLQCEKVWTKILATMFTGFAFSRQGWIQHEGGHNSLTGRPKIDKFIQLISFGLGFGASATWWNSQHNRHHAMPQRLEHDVDLATLPYVAFHRRAVKNANQINRFFIRFQGIFYWTIDLLVVVIVWKFFLHPRYSLRKRAYLELFLSMLNTIVVIILFRPLWFLSSCYWFSFFLGINFALNHSHLDVADKPTHWIEYALTHTANIKSSVFVDYFMGYLNFQIEHHLFPTMPQFRQKQICHRIRALAEKHGLPYRVYNYTEAVVLAIKNLDNVGRNLISDFKNKTNQI